MGIVYVTEDRILILEAVEPVQLVPLDKWIDRGVGGHAVVKRLKNADIVLTPTVLKTMKEEGEKHLGKHYDWHFEWSDERMYCSEIVWKIYERGARIKLCSLATFDSFNLDHPDVAPSLTKRFGDNLPLKEPVVPPSTIFDSPLLETVYRCP